MKFFAKNATNSFPNAFTLIELLVVIAIIGILLALLVPAVQAAREAARRTQCNNHLKQIGLAVHNFHGVHDGVPPATVGVSGKMSGLTFWGLLYPYMDQQSLYDKIMHLTDGCKKDMRNDYCWGTDTVTILNEQERVMFNFNGYFCPTRRTSVPPYGNASATGNLVSGGVFGPQSDYAFLYGTDEPNWPRWVRLPGYDEGGQRPNTIPSDFKGPIRCATLKVAGDLGSWYPTDTMAKWVDGVSNQFLVGEKFIPMTYLSACSVPSDIDFRSCASDCSVLVMGNINTLSPARSYFARFAPNVLYEEDNITSETNSAHWGGTHPTVCNFLVGDGSVRSMSLATPTGKGSILSHLGMTDDGNTVQMP